MIEDICKLIAAMEADPEASVFPAGTTIREYYAAIIECKKHVKECKKCKEALERIPESGYEGPTTTLN